MPQIIRTHELDRDNKLPPDLANQVYNGLDCCVTYDVLNGLRQSATPETDRIYQISRSLQPPVMEATLRGMLVDGNTKARLLNAATKNQMRLQFVWNRLCSGIFDRDFNWGSWKQMQELFYDHEYLNCTEFKSRNSAGRMTLDTSEDAMIKVQVHPRARVFAKIVLGLRKNKKDLDFLERPLGKGGRFMYGANVVGTNSGRMSSSGSDFGEGTNAQNVKPANRAIIIADKGFKLGEFDLEQADSRNFGANCYTHLITSGWDGDAAAYLDACESGDLHTQVAKLVWEDDLPWGTAPDRQIANALFHNEDSYRQTAKKVGHGTNYLGQPFAIHIQTQIPVPLVETFQASYFDKFPCIPALQEHLINHLATDGTFINLFGRRRQFFGRPSDKNVQNEAVAFMGQSCTAEQVNIALILLWDHPMVREGRLQYLLQVHDSLLFQYREEDEEEARAVMSEVGKVVITLLPNTPHERQFFSPLEMKHGWNWGYENEKNPDGMKDWGHTDERKRQGSAPRKRFSLRDRINRG